MVLARHRHDDGTQHRLGLEPLTGQWAFMGTGIAMGIVLWIVLGPNRTQPEKEDQPPGRTK
jgi:hypothetical protein